MPDVPFTAVQSSQGISLQWGTTLIGVTSMQFTKQAAAEIDTTGFANTIYTDPENTQQKVIRKSVDYAVVDPGELSCEFFGPGNFNDSLVGVKRQLSLSGSTALESIQAFLTQISTQIVAGELIRGSCTFKLTD